MYSARLLTVLILFFGTLSFSQIKNVPIYPSGISVSFSVLPEEPESAAPVITKTKNKKIKKRELPPPPAEPEPIQAIKVNKFIRIINAMNLEENQNLALLFYDENKKLLTKPKVLVTNTTKPAATHIFFMDKASSKEFKGVLDYYFIPEKAVYFNVAVLNKKGALVSVPVHPAYDEDNLIAIEHYQSIDPKSRIMLQFEVKGSPKASVMRISAFRFR